jgi:uncharacterized protein YjbI with pentapeptide repeats
MNTAEILGRYARGDRDFHEADLHGADLTEAILAEAVLVEANLHGTDLRGRPEIPVGEPDALNPHVRFDEGEVETGHGAANEAPVNERTGTPLGRT